MYLVRSRGLEPPQGLPPLGPQPSASAIPPRPHFLREQNIYYHDKATMSISFLSTSVRLAGLAGFEPTNNGVKVRCLTAWL